MWKMWKFIKRYMWYFINEKNDGGKCYFMIFLVDFWWMICVKVEYMFKWFEGFYWYWYIIESGENIFIGNGELNCSDK